MYRLGPDCRERLVPLHTPFAAPLRDHGVVMAGLSDLHPPYDQGRPAPDFHLLLHTSAGSGAALLDGRRQELATGSTWVIPAGTPHRYVVGVAPWRIMWFHLADQTRHARLRGRTPSPVPSGMPERFAHLLEMVMAESTSLVPGALRLARLAAEAITIYLDRRLGAFCGEATGDELLEALWAQVDADLARSWSLAALAAASGLSPLRLRRLVGRVQGRTPMEQVAHLRIARARSLYAGGGRTLAEIASRVGYATPFALSKAWKRIAGVCPLADAKKG